MDGLKAFNRLSHYRRTLFPHSNDSNSTSLFDEAVSFLLIFSYFSIFQWIRSNGIWLMLSGIGWRKSKFQNCNPQQTPCSKCCGDSHGVVFFALYFLFWFVGVCCSSAFSVFVINIWKMVKGFWVFERKGF